MVATQRSKVVDKPELIKKIMALLKKTYSSVPLKQELPVLETLLYAICLENSFPERAEQGYARLLNSFQDLNEVRVSSIHELERVFHDMDQPEWRALRVKNVLQYLFETTYSFDFELLKRKTHELATKQLAKIKSLSPFIRAFAQQNALGSHTLPVDDRMLAALQWLGLAELDTSPEPASEHLRSIVRKADGQLFCHLLRCLATDSKLSVAFSKPPAADAVDDLGNAYARLENLIRHGPPASSRKDAARKATAEKSVAGTHGADKQASRTPSAKKPRGEKSPARKESAGRKGAAATPGKATVATVNGARKKDAAKSKGSSGKQAKAVSKKAPAAKQPSKKPK